MKIVITSQGNDLDSDVDPRFGRAKCFLVVDTDSGENQVVDNTQNLNTAQGAGIQAAQTVSKLGAEAVLTGNCGPKAFRVLSAAGIKVYVGVNGTIQGAIEKFNAGEYSPASDSNVEGHW